MAAVPGPTAGSLQRKVAAYLSSWGDVTVPGVLGLAVQEEGPEVDTRDAAPVDTTFRPKPATRWVGLERRSYRGRLFHAFFEDSRGSQMVHLSQPDPLGWIQIGPGARRQRLPRRRAIMKLEVLATAKPNPTMWVSV